MHSNDESSSSIILTSKNPYIQLIQAHLKAYQDIDLDAYEIFENEGNVSNNYMQSTSHLNPIGIGNNYQAFIPTIIPIECYRLRTIPLLQSIKIRQEHDIEIATAFYTKYESLINERFSKRTYEQVNELRNKYNASNEQSFEQYLTLYEQYWQEEYRNRDPNKKKKKSNRMIN